MVLWYLDVYKVASTIFILIPPIGEPFVPCVPIFLVGETLHKCSYDGALLRFVVAKEANQLMSKVHEEICGSHMSGHILAKKFLRLG